MFYIKHNGAHIILGDDPVYNICPICKQEHKVDFWDLYDGVGNDFDLDCNVFCDSCADEHRQQKVRELRLVESEPASPMQQLWGELTDMLPALTPDRAAEESILEHVQLMVEAARRAAGQHDE